MADIPKILIFMKRRPGMSLSEFRDYYENEHVPLCMKYNRGLKRYMRRYIDHPFDSNTGVVNEMDFDVVTELWFADAATRDSALKYAGRGILPQDVIDDEEKLFDRSRNRMVAITEYETAL
jgi:EthD domain